MSIAPHVPPPSAPATSSNGNLPVPVAGDAKGLQIMADWLQAASHAEQLVTPLLGSFFIPASLVKSNIEETRANATACVLYGMSLGLDPMVSLQNIYVVHGRPGMYAKLKVAIVQRAGHQMWTVERTAERCTVQGRRKDWPADRVVEVTLTMQDAERAGWTKTNANYQKTPADMLYARTAGRVADAIAADELHGIASIEDLADVEPDLPPAPARPRVQAVQPAGRAALEPAADGTGRTAGQAVSDDQAIARQHQVAADEPDADQPIEKKQWDAINARLNEIGVAGAGQLNARLMVVQRVIGRQVARGGELTQAEGQLVLDNLAGETGLNLVLEVLDTKTASFPFVGILGERIGQAASAPAADVDPGDADPDGDEDLPDPTTEPGWGEGGAS